METKKVTFSSENDGVLAFRDNRHLEGPKVATFLLDDVIAKILSYLPVKPLLRFKCVSKEWCSLIESARFIKMHLQASFARKTNSDIIISNWNYYSIDFDSLDDATAIEVDDHLKTHLFGALVVGSCNGLFCMLSPEKDILLWNPSTRKCQKLPGSPIDLNSPCCIHGGFGYDLNSNDYKVVLYVHRHLDSGDVQDSNMTKPKKAKLNKFKLIIYSLKKNSWKKMEDLPLEAQFKQWWGALLNGVLHWVISIELEYTLVTILSFELADASYWYLPMPPVEPQNMTVGVLGGCLSTLAKETDGHMNVWVMKEYGKAKSWSKLFSVNQLEVIGSFVTLRPLIYSKSGKDILLLEVNNKNIVWFDLEGDKVKIANVRGAPETFNVEVYTQSLVQLNDDSESGDNDMSEVQFLYI